MIQTTFAQWCKQLVGRRPTGQMGRESELGRWIILLCSLESVTRVVEIGTWRGNGTTRRISEGFKQHRTSRSQAVCLEFNRKMAAEAANRYRRNQQITIVWGRLVGPDDYDVHDLSTDEAQWLKRDMADAAEAPLVWDQLPDEIDLLILDGGEFSTQAEFFALKDRCTGWIALEDTRTRKCREIVRSITSGDLPDFTIVFESMERNGVMLLRRVTPTS